MSRASAANEGKIHLGYVYSGDDSFRTARTMIDDALCFRPLLMQWMGSKVLDALLTAPFHYVVPDDSRLPKAAIKRHFTAVEDYLNTQETATGQRYLGGFEASETIIADGREWIGSREAAICTRGVAETISAAVLTHPDITLCLNSEVDHVTQSERGWAIAYKSPHGLVDGPFDHVVNASWSGRRAIDRRGGFKTPDAFFTRYKFGVLLENAKDVLGGRIPKNTTATTGPFGDSVYYPATDSLYCSWYPVGMCFSSKDDDTSFTQPEVDKHPTLMRQTWKGYATIDPDFLRLLNLSEPLNARLVGDFIVATGKSDIVDPQSQLHERWLHGPRMLAPGYWSIDTGKYTSAPRCAVQCVDAILDRRPQWYES
jgi:hypothetical protein